MENQNSASRDHMSGQPIAPSTDAQQTILSQLSNKDLIGKFDQMLTKYVGKAKKTSSQEVELNELSDTTSYPDCDTSDESDILPSKESFVLKNLRVLKLSRCKELPFFFLNYNTFTNDYVSSVKDYTVKSWTSLIYQSENLDWHMRESGYGYIDRKFISRYQQYPRKTVGKIHWRFDLSKFNCWKRLQIRAHGKIYPRTWIKVMLVGHDEHDESQIDEKTLDINSLNLVTPGQFKFQVGLLDLIVTLSGEDKASGGGSSGAKRPKLFYQVEDRRTTASRDQREPGFVFEIY